MVLVDGKSPAVSTHSRPKAAAHRLHGIQCISCCFNTQPPEGGCVLGYALLDKLAQVSTHSRPKAAACCRSLLQRPLNVSTHSRPKAAAGGGLTKSTITNLFQHTAARRRLPDRRNRPARYARVSTHSRPKAAASCSVRVAAIKLVSTHSRPKAAASASVYSSPFSFCFNTQPPEGGCNGNGKPDGKPGGFNTQPPEGGCAHIRPGARNRRGFQHTAARRRLPANGDVDMAGMSVSTHSRPKAAAKTTGLRARSAVFQHTAARRRLRPLARHAPGG